MKAALPDTRFARALASHAPSCEAEAADVADALDFLSGDPSAFERSNPARHFTGSAIVVDRDRAHVLLTLHGKLGKWLQLGGHCDGIRDPFFVAWKEAYEESGLGLVTPVMESILDVGVHDIPEHRGVAAHRHYDVRYLFEADRHERHAASEESVEIAWVPLADAWMFNPEPEFLRLCRKAAKG